MRSAQSDRSDQKLARREKACEKVARADISKAVEGTAEAHRLKDLYTYRLMTTQWVSMIAST